MCRENLFHMSLGRELLPKGFRVGEFLPQEFRRGSSSHRSSDSGVLATVVQAGKLSPQKIRQGIFFAQGPDMGVLPSVILSGSLSHKDQKESYFPQKPVSYSLWRFERRLLPAGFRQR
jgi:hypothetical protein